MARELLETLERDYIGLEHFHAAADLLCDGESIPLRYVVRGSALHRFLLANSSGHSIPIYEEEFISHHCEGSFFEVYYLFGKYLLTIVLFILHVMLIRKAILWFKPGWGSRKKILV